MLSATNLQWASSSLSPPQLSVLDPFHSSFLSLMPFLYPSPFLSPSWFASLKEGIMTFPHEKPSSSIPEFPVCVAAYWLHRDWALMANTSWIICMCIFKAFMYFNKLLSFYLSTVRGTEETPKLWVAQVTMEMEFPISKVDFSKNEEGFADHGHWMEPLWREAGWHFCACISQLRMYFRHNPIVPGEHTDFQKMAPWKKYWTETFQWDQNIWMGKAHNVRMDMDGKGAFARKPHSQLGLGWIQLCQRWIHFCWAPLQLPEPSSHGRRRQLQGTWAVIKQAQSPVSLSCVCTRTFLEWAGRALQTLAPNTAQSCPLASTEWKSDPQQGQKIAVARGWTSMAPESTASKSWDWKAKFFHEKSAS